MADNTQLNVGTGGDVIATDDISGVKYQRVKLTLGSDGVTNGDVSSKNPMPVNDATKLSDVFQQGVSAGRYNQIEIEYASTDPDLITDITVTKTNGGDAINSGGQAVFSTSTNTSGSVKAVSNTSISYRPHFEVYAAFSCIFSAGLASSYQRIGLYDTNNGFFIGYEGTSFGITIRKGGVDTTTAQSSFNVDTLLATSSSKFTRNGTPESLDTTKDNLYRIRFGWLGAAPITFEVFSPDGEWVVFHTIKHPNTVAATSINSPDLPLTLDLKKTSAGATNLTMSTACWAAGTTSDLSKIGGTVTDNTLVKPVKSILVAKKPNGSYTNIEATAGGNLKVAIQESDPAAIINVAQSGTWNINNVSGTISLPTGAATSANQTTEITSLQLLDDVVATDGSAALTKLYQVGGTDGTNAQILSTNVSGHLNIADGGNSITVDGTVAATQSGSWNVGLNAGSNAIGSITNTSFAVTQATAASLNATVVGTGTFAVQAAQSGTYTVRTQDGAGNALASSTTTPAGTEQALIVRNIPSGTQTISGTVTANAGTGTFAVGDGGGSLTVDGTVAATQSGTWILGANSGVDIGDVTINNASGASAVNIQDGGNSITVDGTVAATQSGTWNIGTLTSITNTVTTDTELPAAAALADGASNPTTPTVGAAQLAFNGTTFDRVKSTDALAGTGANNTATGILAVGTGPGYAIRHNPTALGTAVNSATTIEVEGGNTMSWGIGTTTTGTFIFEATSDATNWISVEVFDAGLDQWVSGQNLTPTAGKTYHVACGGYRQVRLRVTATLGATVTHIVNVTNSQQLLAGIDTGAAPHNFGYTLFHKEGNYAATQTTTTLHATTAGKKFAITDITVSTDGTTAGVVTIYDAANATAFSAGTTPSIFRASFAPSATSKPGATKHFPVPYVSAVASNYVLVTITGITASYIQINGYEI